MITNNDLVKYKVIKSLANQTGINLTEAFKKKPKEIALAILTMIN